MIPLQRDAFQLMPAMPMMPPPAGPAPPSPPAAAASSLSMPVPTLPRDATDAATMELVSYIQKRQADLPLDVQQKIQSTCKKQGARATKDLHSAVKLLDTARSEYEQALLARAQHIGTWKTFLAEAVKNWSEYGTMFADHEKALQQRIAAAKEQFKEAKLCLEESKTHAGKLQVQEISDEEELPMESETSAQQIHASIQSLSTSLHQLSKEADSIKVEEHVSKRLRTDEPKATDVAMASEAPSHFH